MPTEFTFSSVTTLLIEFMAIWTSI